MSVDLSGRHRTFDDLFANDPDPWNFETSAYEAIKRRETLAMLHSDRCPRAIEVGCANGVLTAQLADVCEKILAVDVSANALRHAARRVAPLDNVELLHAEVPREWPEGTFDLIVLSEILYFLSAEEVAQMARRSWDSLTEDGVCLLVNWTGPNNLPVDGQKACEIFIQELPWLSAVRGLRPSYRIDRLHKTITSKDFAKTER